MREIYEGECVESRVVIEHVIEKPRSFSIKVGWSIDISTGTYVERLEPLPDRIFADALQLVVNHAIDRPKLPSLKRLGYQWTPVLCQMPPVGEVENLEQSQRGNFHAALARTV